MKLAPRMIAAGVLTGLAAFAGLYAFHALETFLIRDPRFALSEPTLEGVSHTPTGAMEGIFAEDAGRSLYLIPLADRRASLRRVDWVKDATVLRVWPNRIIAKVTERTPVAFVTLGAGRVALIDEDGVILSPAKDRFTLPVLAGVRVSDRIAERRDRVQRLLALTRELGDAAQKISEVDVSDPDNLKVNEPFDGRIVTLLLGDHNFAARHRNFLNHFAEIKRKLPGASTLDLRLEDRITVVE